MESHYKRKDCSFEFLPVGLNQTSMQYASLYLQWCKENSKTCLTKRLYFDILDTKFYLKFNWPQKDACDTCTQFYNLSRDQKTNMALEEHNDYLLEKNHARTFKLQVREKALSQDFAAAFDAQKVMWLPHGQTSSFYFTRRLRVMNFTVTNLTYLIPCTNCGMKVKPKKNHVKLLHASFNCLYDCVRMV